MSKTPKPERMSTEDALTELRGLGWTFLKAALAVLCFIAVMAALIVGTAGLRAAFTPDPGPADCAVRWEDAHPGNLMC